MDHSLVQLNETMSHAMCFSVYDKDYNGPQNLKNLLFGPLQRKKVPTLGLDQCLHHVDGGREVQEGT